MGKLTLRECFDNGTLIELPELVQECLNLEHGRDDVYMSAIQSQSQRLNTDINWFIERLSKLEISQLEEPSDEQIREYINYSGVELDNYSQEDQSIIYEYADEVLTEILDFTKSELLD